MAAASLDRVAELAGCSRNLAYRYFPNHESLVQALADRERLAVLERLSQLPSHDPFDVWFDQVVDAVLDLAEQRGRLLLMLFEAAMFARSAKRREFVVEMITTKLEHDGLAPGRARVSAPILGAAMMGAAGVVVSQRGDRRVAKDELAKVASALLAES